MENLNAEQIIKALECCIEGECDGCTYDEQTACKEYLLHDALALINSQEQRIKDLTSDNVQFRHEQGKLIVERDTFREYAYNMQKYVESINHKEEEGYEPSAARYAAEMEMWHRVELQTKRIEDENAEQEKAIINALDRMGEIRREITLVTARKMQERLKMYFGTYTLGYKIPLNEVLKVINQIAKEMLEGNDDND